MSSEILAGMISGLIAALPYLVMMGLGLVEVLRGRPTREFFREQIQFLGAITGTLLGSLTTSHVVFFLIWFTRLAHEPSPITWGLGLSVPTLLTGWLSYLGVLQDPAEHRFRPLLFGLFLGILGFCTLPIGLVVFLAGMIFGKPHAPLD